MSAVEVGLDVAELERLREGARRPTVQALLDKHISLLKVQRDTLVGLLINKPTVQALLDKHISLLKVQRDTLVKKAEATEAKVAVATPVAVTPTTAGTAMAQVKITQYAWDQSDKFVKIYISLKKGASPPKDDQVNKEFTEKSFSLQYPVENTMYSLTMVGLLDDILPESSYVKVKSEDVLVMLRKGKDGKQWDCLTKAAHIEKEKKAPKLDEKDLASGDPQGSMMKMMKQMYDDGDDNMKRSIRQAWHQGQDKKSGVSMDGLM